MADIEEGIVRDGDLGEDSVVRLTDVLNGLPLPDPEIVTNIMNAPVKQLWKLVPTSSAEALQGQVGGTIAPSLEIDSLEEAFQMSTWDAILEASDSGKTFPPELVGEKWRLVMDASVRGTVVMHLRPTYEADPSENPIAISFTGNESSKLVSLRQGNKLVELEVHEGGYRLDHTVSDFEKGTRRVFGIFKTSTPGEVLYSVNVKDGGSLKSGLSARRPRA